MIILLASYPKSGNTLLRSILSSYFYTSDGMFKFGNLNKIIQFPIVDQFMSIGVDIKNDKEVFNNFINAQNAINKNSSKIKFLKTHSSLSKMYDCDFTDLKIPLALFLSYEILVTLLPPSPTTMVQALMIQLI